MTWEIKIPFQSRDQTITEAIEAHVNQALEGEDREVAFQLLFNARFKTMGELIDHVESLDTEGQRRVLDQARKAAGLEASEDIDSRERFERYNRALPKGRDAEGRTFQVCAEPNCNAWPQGPEQGEPLAVADRKWWCDRHKDQAGPDDHLPPEPKYELDYATMSLRAVGAERERLLEEDRKREQNAREREERRREEDEAVGAVKRRYVEQAEPENWAGFWVRPDGRVVE